MILNQPDGSRIEQQEEEPTAKAQMAVLGERLKALQGQHDRLVPVFEVPSSLREPDFERIRAIVREELRTALIIRFENGKLHYGFEEESNEPTAVLDGRVLYGMTYRGYSLTDLDTMIDFYRMHHHDKR